MARQVRGNGGAEDMTQSVKCLSYKPKVLSSISPKSQTWYMSVTLAGERVETSGSLQPVGQPV